MTRLAEPCQLISPRAYLALSPAGARLLISREAILPVVRGLTRRGHARVGQRRGATSVMCTATAAQHSACGCGWACVCASLGERQSVCRRLRILPPDPLGPPRPTVCVPALPAHSDGRLTRATVTACLKIPRHGLCYTRRPQTRKKNAMRKTTDGGPLLPAGSGRHATWISI